MPARRSPGRLDAEQAFAWRDFEVSDYDDSGQVAWMESKGIDLLRGSARIEGPGQVSVDGSTYATDAHRDLDWLGPRDPAGAGTARARRRLDQPRGHRPHRGASAAARPRRRPGRRRDGPGAPPDGRRGRPDRGHGPSARPRAEAARRRPRRGAPGRGDRAPPRQPGICRPQGGRRVRARGRHERAPRRPPAGRDRPAAPRRRARARERRHRAGQRWHRGRRADARRRRRLGDRGRERRLAAHLRRQVPGRESSPPTSPAATARPTTARCRGWSSPTRRPPPSARPRGR